MTRHPSHQQGFALIVVGALFIAFALVSAAVIDRTNATKQLDTIARTQAQLSRISEALMRYSLANNNRYPCPASMTTAVTDATFGQAVTGCQTGTPTGITVLTSSATIRGMVPVLELLTYGVDPSDAFDAWGNRIAYVVDRQMTPAGTPGTPAANRPAITDAITSATFRDPDFMLISFGRDGLGATPRNSTSVAIACSGTDPRALNCDGDLSFTTRPITTGPGLTAAQYYDDIIVFYGR